MTATSTRISSQTANTNHGDDGRIAVYRLNHAVFTAIFTALIMSFDSNPTFLQTQSSWFDSLRYLRGRLPNCTVWRSH